MDRLFFVGYRGDAGGNTVCALLSAFRARLEKLCSLSRNYGRRPVSTRSGFFIVLSHDCRLLGLAGKFYGGVLQRFAAWSTRG